MRDRGNGIEMVWVYIQGNKADAVTSLAFTWMSDCCENRGNVVELPQRYRPESIEEFARSYFSKGYIYDSADLHQYVERLKENLIGKTHFTHYLFDFLPLKLVFKPVDRGRYYLVDVFMGAEEEIAKGIHCQELGDAAPILSSLKKAIVIAKVNADKFTCLTRKYDINGYPTLKVLRHGVPVEYKGPRKAELLDRYLKKVVAPDVLVIDSDTAISNFVEAVGPHFPIFIGLGLKESMISKLADRYKKKAWFSVAKDLIQKMLDHNPKKRLTAH